MCLDHVYALLTPLTGLLLLPLSSHVEPSPFLPLDPSPACYGCGSAQPQFTLCVQQDFNVVLSNFFFKK